ncbi:MAG: histidine kinase [Lachnospiraceae bacterium]
MKVMIYKRKSRSIASVIIWAFVLVTILPVISLGLYSYSSLSKEVKTEFRNNSKTVIAGIDNNLDIYFKGIKTITMDFFGSGTVQEILQTNPETMSEILITKNRFDDYASELVKARTDIANIILCDLNNNQYKYEINILVNESPGNEEVIEALNEAGGKFTIFGVRVQGNGSNYAKKVITVGRAIKNFKTREVAGYLIMDLNYSKFVEMIGLSAMNEQGTLLVTDSEEQVLYNSSHKNEILVDYSQLDIYSEVSNNKSGSIVSIPSDYFDWNYIFLSNNEIMLNKLNQIVITYILVTVLIFLLFLIVAFLIGDRISKSMKRLGKAMQTAQSNQFNEIVPSFDSYEEVNRLAQSFNVMLVEIQRLLDRERKLNKRRMESDYKALQMQITPHFLYNSLDSINCLAAIYGHEDISEMILSLAEIFKYNMRYESKVATFLDEITHVKNYCMLQAVHYQDRFRIEYRAEEQYMSREVIKFMLQPLVENAIYHGINIGKGGIIILDAYDGEDGFHVSVSDNGKGIDSGAVRELNASLQRSSEELFQEEKETLHIGLLNVNLRLKLQYGEKAGILIRSETGKGTVAEIIIPFERKEHV